MTGTCRWGQIFIPQKSSVAQNSTYKKSSSSTQKNSLSLFRKWNKIKNSVVPSFLTTRIKACQNPSSPKSLRSPILNPKKASHLAFANIYVSTPSLPPPSPGHNMTASFIVNGAEESPGVYSLAFSSFAVLT